MRFLTNENGVSEEWARELHDRLPSGKKGLFNDDLFREWIFVVVVGS